MRIFNKGFNYSQDGPGNRLVYHLQGCNFKCPWCSNPEGMVGKCEKTVDVPIDEIYAEILSCKPMFFDGGGVTFTGGEATLQADELFPLLKKLRTAGINSCLETNGSYEKLPKLAELIDFLIMDIKHFKAEEHLKLTGNDAEIVYKNIMFFCNTKKKVLIRIPLINGLNTDADGFVKFFSGINCENLKFEFLPYHEYGKAKWVEQYTIKNGFITDEKLQEFINKFADAGLIVFST